MNAERLVDQSDLSTVPNDVMEWARVVVAFERKHVEKKNDLIEQKMDGYLSQAEDL